MFDLSDYALAYLIFMGLALPLGILAAAAAYQFCRRADLALLLFAAFAGAFPDSVGGQLAALLAPIPASGRCPTIFQTCAFFAPLAICG